MKFLVQPGEVWTSPPAIECQASGLDLSCTKSHNPIQSCRPAVARLCLRENCRNYWCRWKRKPGQNNMESNISDRFSDLRDKFSVSPGHKLLGFSHQCTVNPLQSFQCVEALSIIVGMKRLLIFVFWLSLEQHCSTKLCI